MFYYAVTYFQRSAALRYVITSFLKKSQANKDLAIRPYDSRMWSALGGCYEKLGNLNEAFKAHKRSLLSSEPSDMSAFERICMVCEQMGKPDLAAQFHRRAIEAAIAEDLDLSEYQRSLMALAKYELEVKDSSGLHCGDFETAERCLNKLAASNSVGDVRFPSLYTDVVSFVLTLVCNRQRIKQRTCSSGCRSSNCCSGNVFIGTKNP